MIEYHEVLGGCCTEEKNHCPRCGALVLFERCTPIMGKALIGVNTELEVEG